MYNYFILGSINANDPNQFNFQTDFGNNHVYGIPNKCSSSSSTSNRILSSSNSNTNSNLDLNSLENPLYNTCDPTLSTLPVTDPSLMHQISKCEISDYREDPEQNYAFKFVTYILLYNNLIPISLYMTLDLVRKLQAVSMQNDKDLFWHMVFMDKT